jgi:hypothetical protein
MSAESAVMFLTHTHQPMGSFCTLAPDNTAAWRGAVEYFVSSHPVGIGAPRRYSCDHRHRRNHE